MYLSLRYLQFTPLMAETMRAANPIFLVLMTPLLKGKRVPRGAVGWMIVGFGGALLLFDRALQVSWHHAAGIGVSVVALLLANGALLYAKRTLQHISPVLAVGLLLVLPAMVLAPLGVHALHGERVTWNGDMVTAMALLCVTGVIGSVLAMWLLQCADAYRVIMVRVAAPVVMMAESWCILGGRPGLEMTVAAVLMALSVVAVLRMRDDAEKTMTIFVHEDRRRTESGSVEGYRRQGTRPILIAQADRRRKRVFLCYRHRESCKLTPMAASMYIVVEGNDPGYDIFVNGRALARHEDAVERLALRLGVKPLIEFFSADENSMALLIAEGAGNPDLLKRLPPPQWYAPQDGLTTVAALVAALRDEPQQLGTEGALVLAELEEYERVLLKTQEHGLRWHLAVSWR